MRPLVSIVSAVFNEQHTIPILYDRLRTVMAACGSDYDFEIIFTNNASTDRTAELVAELRDNDPRVQLLTLSRNFGYQCSVQAGITYAAGDVVIVIDADCEDPPEMIPVFLERWRAGYDVVYGSREDRPESWIIKKSRDVFYYILRASADMDIVLFMAEFALITSEVRDAIIDNVNSRPFLRAEVGYVGFRRQGIRYKREKRVAGSTHYNLFGMAKFAIAGLLTASTASLRVAAYLLPAVVLLNAFALVWDWYSGVNTGFRSAIIFDLVYIIGLLSVFGLYIARIYKNTMHRPNYVVSRRASLLNREFPVRRQRELYAVAQ